MWFTETPWPPIYLCFGIFLLLFIYGVTTGHGRSIAIGLGILLVCPLLYLVERSIVTDAEVLEQAVIDLTDDVQQNRQEQVLDQISEEAVVLRGLISTGMARYQLEESLRISDLNVEMQADGKSAKAHLRANGTVSDRGSSGVQGQRFPSRWNLYFEREGDDWKISKIERLSPTSGKSMPILATRIQ